MKEFAGDEPVFACASDGKHQPGITLRQYYAGQIATGLAPRLLNVYEDYHLQNLAKTIFRLADEMVKVDKEPK
jgi:hypothetical protein